VPAQVTYAREGVVSNHRMGDVMHLLRVFLKRDPMRALLYPKRTHALRDFLILPKGTISDVWSLHDPKPALMEIIDIFKKFLPKK